MAGPVFGSFVKEGAGTLTLGGIADNSVISGIVNEGLLILAKDSSRDCPCHQPQGHHRQQRHRTARGHGRRPDYNEAIVRERTMVACWISMAARNASPASRVPESSLTRPPPRQPPPEVGDWGADSTFDGTLQDGAGTLALAKTGVEISPHRREYLHRWHHSLGGRFDPGQCRSDRQRKEQITFRGGTLRFSEAKYD